MKRLLDEVIDKRPFLKLYFDPEVTHLNVNRLLEQDELRDVTQGLNVSDFITHFSYKADINKDTKAQKNSIINVGLRSGTAITYLDLQEENFYTPNPQQSLPASLIPQMLSTNHSLVYLNLANNNLGEPLGKVIAQSLKGNNSILYFNISGNSLGEKGFEPIATALQYNNSITDLDISNNSLSVQGGRYLSIALKGNNSIKHLNLKNNQLTDQGSEEVISALNKEIVIYLDISSNNIDNQAVKALAHFIKNNTSLQYLNISNNNVGKTPEFTDALKFNSTLKILHVASNSLGNDKSIKFIADVIKENNGLTSLNLNDNYFSYTGAKDISNALIVNKSLTILKIKNSNFDEAGAVLLAQGLEQNTTVTKLDLSNNNLQDTGFIFLANALKESNSITHLNLSHNEIQAKGIEAVSYILSSIIYLDISGNNIGVNGAATIGDALKTNHSLVYLNLSQNQLQHQGIKSVLTALENNSSLVLLDINNNNIGDTGAGNIASLLKDNKSLAILNIGSNGITQTGAAHIADLISNNSFIACIEFSGNNVTQQGANLINTALSSNYTVIKFTTYEAALSNTISSKIIKNNQLLQEKLQGLVYKKFENKAEDGIFKELLTLVKQLQVSTEKSITSELSNTMPLTTKEYLQIIANIFKEESLKHAQIQDTLMSQESLISENQYIEILSNMDIAGATDYYYDWS